MSVSPDPSREPEPRSAGILVDRGRNALRRGARVLGLALLALMALLFVRGMANSYGYLSFDPAVLFAIGLVAAGVLLLRGQVPVYEGVTPSRVEAPRSPLGILTLSAVFLVVGLMLLLGNLGVAELVIAHMAAAALLIVGLGLLVGSWWGRSRLLIVVGVLLVPIVIISGFIHFPLRGSIGSRFITVQSIEELPKTYEILTGTLYLDLLEVEDFPTDRTINFEIATGEVTILVPQRVGLTITGDIEWGNAVVGRGYEQGEDLHFGNHVEGRPGEGHLELNFHGGIARVYVERISHRERFGPPDRKRRQERRDDQRRSRDRKERRDREEGRKRAKA